MVTAWQALVVAFLCLNLGLLMELYCPKRQAGQNDTTGRLCRENGSIFRWTGTVALCVLAVYIAYRYAKAAANAK